MFLVRRDCNSHGQLQEKALQPKVNVKCAQGTYFQLSEMDCSLFRREWHAEIFVWNGSQTQVTVACFTH